MCPWRGVVLYFILEWHCTCFGRFSVHHHEFKTVHTATGICQTDTAVCLLASSRLCLFPYRSVIQNWAGPRILDLLVKYRHNTNFKFVFGYVHHNHHKHQGLDPLILSVFTVTAALANASSVFQLFSFLVVCSGMISKGFGYVAFFASVAASSVCINLSCLVCL